MAGITTRASRAQALSQNQHTAVPRMQPQQRSQPPGRHSAGSGPGSTDEADDPGTSNGSATSQQAEYLRIERSRRSTALPHRQANEMLDTTAKDKATIGYEADALSIHMKEVISVIHHLEGLGLQKQDIQLPKCVVLGEQSSGKSSVIEAISGVRTPRAGGTCTRCPLFISLASSNDAQDVWSAHVGLRFNYKYDPMARTSHFPGWNPNQGTVEMDFARCTSPGQLEEAIHRAQLALVHPLEDPEVFAQGRITPFEHDAGHTVNFSPNIVCIHVKQPGLPNLSFYDLPGLISQSENPTDVSVVKKLVQDYVQDPDALVLVACSLAADIATSIASGFARNEWNAGSRCIGVLTKPDLLPAGSSDKPLNRVLNKMELKFGHGYFVVKNPDQVMLNNRLTHQEAREQERQFFATTEPWCSSLKAHQGRFGTANLQQYLSEQLAGLMLKALPTIYDQVQARLDGIEQELGTIPEPPPIHNAVRIVSDLLNNFSEHVRKELEAEYPCKDWKSVWTVIQKRFIEALLKMRPTMRTSGQLDLGIYSSTLPGNSSSDPVCVDDDAETLPLPETPSKKRKLDGTPAATSTKARAIKMAVSTPTKPPVHTASYTDLRTIYHLDEVVKHFEEHSKSKIHDQLQPQVINDMIKHTLRNWQVPLKDVFEELERDLKTQLRETFDRYFGSRMETRLYAKAWSIVEKMFNTSMTEQRSTLANDTLNNELEAPYIFHQQKFDDAKEALRERYANVRFNARMKIYREEFMEHVGVEKVPPEERMRKDERIRTLLIKEPYQKEIDVIARITSYYELAADRFHDSICMSIEGKFFKRLRTKLRDEMDDSLGIHDMENGAQTAMQLLEESSNSAKRRKELLAMKKALLEGQNLLDNLQAKHGNSLDALRPSSSTFTSSADQMDGVTHGYY